MNVAFPESYRPDQSRIHTRNELLIRAPVEVIWRALIRAADWHTFYDNCKDLHFEPSTAGPDLGAGTTFVWRTFGIRVRTTVVEWDPPHRFAWKGKSWAGRGYHGWVLDGAGSSTRVITEETQSGLVPMLGGAVLRQQLHAAHDRWLAGLARVSETG